MVVFFLSAVLILMAGCSQQEQKSGDVNKTQLAEQVRAEFLHAWIGYKEHAWGHDGLKPISGGYYDWYAEPFYMTALDAFDTMKLMGLDEEARRAKELVLDSLDFDKDISVQAFEINIRLLGGLLSAYQMEGDERFLELARDLGERLLPMFDSPTGMPYRFVNLRTGETSEANSNPAEIGTLLLEFGTLSKLTGDPVFYDKAKQALVALYERRSDLDLVGSGINVETGEWGQTESHVGGFIDSYYEYLLKGWKLFGDQKFKEMWETTIDALNRHVADTVDSGFWYGYVDMRTGEMTRPHFGSLHAFFPGVLALDGDLERAKMLQKSCMKMWNLEGIEPELINYREMSIENPTYYLRPEIMESAYYLYHYTGDQQYLRMGEAFLNGLMEHCKTEHGYAMLKSVVTKEKQDKMESFFLAETLKYLYLLFAPGETLNLDEVIFNTEAHPLRNTWDQG
mgnify:CR=1 FL=1